MKAVKSKKLFGMLSVLDACIIIIVLAVVLPMLHYYMKFNEKGFVEQKGLERFIGQKMRNDIVNQLGWRTKALDVDVSFKNLTESALKCIKAGDREMAPDGTVIGEILRTGKPGPNYFLADVGTVNNRIFVKTLPEDGLYSLPAKLRLKGVIGDAGVFTYKDKSVKDLTEFKFVTGSYETYFVVEMPLSAKSED